MLLVTFDRLALSAAPQKTKHSTSTADTRKTVGSILPSIFHSLVAFVIFPGCCTSDLFLSNCLIFLLLSIVSKPYILLFCNSFAVNRHITLIKFYWNSNFFAHKQVNISMAVFIILFLAITTDCPGT